MGIGPELNRESISNIRLTIFVKKANEFCLDIKSEEVGIKRPYSRQEKGDPGELCRSSENYRCAR